MCGITGLFSFQQREEFALETLQKINRSQSHRGPDDEGYYLQPSIGLGHRRLSIIDVSGGHQPIFNEDGSVAVVFNGEIFNHHEIAEDLKAKGHTFKTKSDTETIVHAWEEWGVECVHQFRGMFAFLVWDSNQKILFAARDRLGIKPLHYTRVNDHTIVFGSELKTLKQHPQFDKTLDKSAIEDYLTFGYVPDPKAIYQSVKKLEAGHYLLLKQGDESTDPAPVQYWDLPWDTKLLDAPDANNPISEELITRLKEAVNIRLESEVPLGAFLSGGVDSSAIVAMMSQLQSSPVKTCAIGFDVDQYDETEFAALVAERYKTHHSIDVVDKEDFDLIDSLYDIYDEPYADSSAIPTFRVCELARKHVTVALSGDGGDELFAGYRRYRLHMAEEKVRQTLPQWLRQSVFKPLGKLYPKLDWAPQFLRAKTTFQSLAKSSSSAYLNSMSKLRADERDQLYSDTFKRELNEYSSDQVFERYRRGKQFSDPLKEIQYLDYKTWVTGDIHTKVDRASMRHGLEVRVPIFDHKLVEWAFTLPSNLHLKNGEGKASLKAALEPHLPHDNLYRKKMGFSVPMAEWLRGPLKPKLESLLFSETFEQQGIFDTAQLRKIVDEHTSGRFDHAASLWTIMMLAQFIVRDDAST